MTRRALLVANSVVYSITSKSISLPIITRTVHQLSALLTDLESRYAFDVTSCIDERGQTIIRKLEMVARQAAQDDDLLLFYYFGHGDLLPDGKLIMLNRGPSKGEHDKVGLEQLETRVEEAGVAKSLFLLDCCYAGAMEKTLLSTLTGNHCRIAATAPAAKAFVMSGTVENPVGKFTAALMRSFTTPEACASPSDNSVTAISLFNYLQKMLATGDREHIQKPQMQGALHEALFEYRAAPRLRPEYSHWADEKTSYAKIVAICRALIERSFDTAFPLHQYLIREYRASFQTLYKRANGSFEYGPVGHNVVVRYLGLMRRMDLLQRDSITLSQRGKLLASRWESRGNELLLKAVDDYLQERGMSRNDLIDATRQVLGIRLIPTKSEVADRLSLNGYRLLKSDVGILLDLLAYAGALRVAAQRAYFAW